MKLLIKKNAGSIFASNHYKNKSPQYYMPTVTRDYADQITAIQGMEIEVETEFLWTNQFNTAPIEGISDSGLRILDFKSENSIIESIIDDARFTRHRCKLCDHFAKENWTEGEPCWWCGK